MSYSSKYTQDEKKIQYRIVVLQRLIFGNKLRAKKYAIELEELKVSLAPKYKSRKSLKS